jgi:hypothetical protein
MSIDSSSARHMSNMATTKTNWFISTNHPVLIIMISCSYFALRNLLLRWSSSRAWLICEFLCLKKVGIFLQQFSYSFLIFII